jgi:16S rRNA (cytidine1402-2'-O)-methyltransferase
VLTALRENEKAEKGEYCVVLELPEKPPETEAPEEGGLPIEARLIRLMQDGKSLREAQEDLMASGEKKNAVKQAALALKKLFTEP